MNPYFIPGTPEARQEHILDMTPVHQRALYTNIHTLTFIYSNSFFSAMHWFWEVGGNFRAWSKPTKVEHAEKFCTINCVLSGGVSVLEQSAVRSSYSINYRILDCYLSSAVVCSMGNIKEVRHTIALWLSCTQCKLVKSLSWLMTFFFFTMAVIQRPISLNLVL